MTWIGLWDHDTSLFDPKGLHSSPAPGADAGHAAVADDALLTRGTLLLETKLSEVRRPKVLLSYASGGSWPVQISLQSIPGGGITLVIDQAGELHHGSVRQPHTERLETLRILYSWDAPRKWGRLIMEHVESGLFAVGNMPAPPPLRLRDLDALTRGTGSRFITPEARFLAVSSKVEPAGPMPSLTSRTPILTPEGERPVASLNRGDTIRSDTGALVPVLYRLSRTVPARGCFAPVRLRTPYFGLQRDIIVAPTQRLKITGSTVEYMFGTEAVLANASHLLGGTATLVEAGPLITYHHLILPQHDAMLAAGTALESLHIGRLRRKRDLLPATMLQDIDRNQLPEHSTPAHPLLRQYDALVLAEQRSA